MHYPDAQLEYTDENGRTTRVNVDVASGHFTSVWQNCTRLLSKADKVVFLGYSMSAVDFHAQFIMRCGFHNQVEGELTKGGHRDAGTGRAEVIIVNPDRDAAERTRAIVGPQHKCRWIPKTVADLRWQRL